MIKCQQVAVGSNCVTQVGKSEKLETFVFCYVFGKKVMRPYNFEV